MKGPTLRRSVNDSQTLPENMLAMVVRQAMNTFLSAVCPLCRPLSILLQSRSGISTGTISEVAIPSLHAPLRLVIAKQNRSGVAKEWVYYRNPMHLLVGLQVFCEQVAAARDFAAATINASQNES